MKPIEILWRRSRGLILATVVTGWMLSGAAAAQNLPTHRGLTFEVAKAVAQGEIEKCRADGQRVTVTVLDAGGTVRVTLRDDGAGPHTPDLAQKKASTALFFGRPTADPNVGTPDAPKPYTPGVTEAAGGVNLAGGLPIKLGDETIGAVGVSGARDDVACASAGLAKVQDKLK